MADLTFVTAYYKIYAGSNEAYVEQFKRFAVRGYPIIIFTDQESRPHLDTVADLPNITIRSDLPFDNLAVSRLFPKTTTELPANRNAEKDTYEYLVLMNSKMEFMTKADVSTGRLAWIDFGISKIIKNMDLAFKKINNLSIPVDKALIPGCHEPTQVLIDRVHWRFCGGLVFTTKSFLDTLFTETMRVLGDLARHKKLTWEVNVWAMLEEERSTLFKWYKADHNDTIFDFPIQKRVMVVIMIKNEERIIKRCIERALSIADAICISDTGSTDNTVNLLTEYLPTVSCPTKLVGHDWKNFGHNRTLSFLAAQAFCKELGWDADMTYGLAIDADMNFVVTPKFDKTSLTANGYRINQKTPGVEYYNTRFMNLGYPWKCTGVTHEYWDGAETESLDTVYIDDIGDGGCKDDKFERDERLLRKGLEEDPTNVRYMFYLAQTLKDLKKLDESIEFYKKRIDAGGWYEEVWYSMYQISRLYYELNKLPEMEYWALRAYEFNKNRSENLYFLTRVFREKSEHYKAWYYMLKGLAIKKSNELLFLEHAVYDHLFHYEKTILNYYIQPHKSMESLIDLINYYNRYSTNVYHNLEHYVQPIKHLSIRRLPFEMKGDYVATSTSILRQKDQYLLNVRYVNYRIQHDGSYLMYVDGNLSGDNPVRTRNFKQLFDANFNPISPMEEMKPSFPKLHDVHIQGVEDLRLYDDGGQLKWVGTSKEYSYDGTIKQIMGTYDTSENRLTSYSSLRPPTQSDCEKNWIPLGNDEFIYAWHPYRIGKIDRTTDSLVIKEHQATPRIFEHMRGSSNVVEYDGSLYAITHMVMYLTPRKYYHVVVRLNKATRRVEAYTMPFYFCKNHIEYCLGIEIRKDVLTAIVSQNDCDPIMVQIDFESLKFHNI